MISDTIENAASYRHLSPRIAVALDFLQRPDLGSLEHGKHLIDGDKLFAIIQEYTTKSRADCFWESHRKYTDVQFIQSGIEAIGWSPIQRMKLIKPYDAEKDLQVLEVLEGQGQIIELRAGQFAIFMPHDAHMPSLAAASGAQAVRKIVVKVAVD
jgi:biofilm protein TabA